MDAPTIAVFNHSPQLLKLFDHNLTARGYHVETFIAPLTDIRIVADLAPDVIILGNIRAFTRDEIALIHALRRSPQLKAVPVIIATTVAQLVPEDIRALSQISILSKPFDIPLLLACIHEVLPDKPGQR